MGVYSFMLCTVHILTKVTSALEKHIYVITIIIQLIGNTLQ